MLPSHNSCLTANVNGPAAKLVFCTAASISGHSLLKVHASLAFAVRIWNPKARRDSAKDVDRARPDQVTILLRQTHIEGVVADCLELYPPGQQQLPVRVFVREPEHANAAADAARLERQILKPDIGDRDLAFDQRRLDPKHARS